MIISKVFKSKLIKYKLHKAFGEIPSDSSFKIPFEITGGEYASIGKNFHVNSYFRLELIDKYNNQHFTPKLLIGDNVSIGQYCHIGCINRIEIGNGVLIGSRVLIEDHSHGNTVYFDYRTPTQRDLISKEKIIIGDNVWIGDGCVIMPGVNIGNNCIVGANSVVTKSFPKNVVIGGVPAKIIRELEVRKDL